MPSGRADRGLGLPVGDLVLAGLLAVLSLSVIGSSLRMPRPEGWAEAPGLFPLICGVGLLGMAMVLAVATWRRRSPDQEKTTGGDADAAPPELGRTLVVGGSVVVYVLVLIPLLHYTVATFVYLFALIWYFWRGKLLWILVLSLAGAIFFSQTFEHAFSIILP